LTIVYLLLLFISSLKPESDNARDNTSDTSQAPIASVASVFPKQNINVEYLPIQQLEVTFTTIISPSDITVSSSPKAKIKITTTIIDAKTLVFSPEPSWSPGITTINISSVSKGGKRILPEDFTYRLNTEYPKSPPADSEEYNH
jgi:hypothetical protein